MRKSILIKITISLLLLFVVKISFSQSYKPISVEDIWQKYIFYPEFPEDMTLMNDSKNYTLIENNIFINKYDLLTGKKIETLFELKKINNPLTNETFKSIDNFSFSKDESKILLVFENKSIYRNSKEGWNYVYDFKTKKLLPIFEKGKQRLVDFSPDGNYVAFVYENNLYIKDLKTENLKQITLDGKVNNIINGTTDWVYEEEFDITKGFYWSEDSKNIAFMRFDESNVKEFSMTMWGELYPTQHKYKYPKAGEENSKVDILVYSLANDNSTKLNVGSENYQYIPRISWIANTNSLMVLKMNRLQNRYELLKYDISNGKNEIIFVDDSKYWVDVPPTIKFLNNGNQLITTSERDGFNHIYLVNFKVEKSKKSVSNIFQITKGQFDIGSISGIDEKNRIIYYTSSESAPINKELYSIKFDGTKKTKISQREGNYEAQFTKDFSYYINTFHDANTPPIISVNDNKGKTIKTIIDNKKLGEKILEFGFQKKEFFSFNTKDTKLNGWMIKPKNFDANKKYPVLMYVYGGPGSQSVDNKWGYFDLAWYNLLAQKGYIVACIDNRGTADRGVEFKKVVYKQLGNLETEDQIEGAKYLSSQPYINSNRIGIFGWSYGGYMSTLCITKGADVFKTAIAVAPVTNWRYYDNIYTERFMRTPQENPNGYDDNSPIKHIKNLKGNYLIIHGTADDNVHYQNAMEIINALIKENKKFDQFTYPNKNHFITGGYTRLHLYNMLTNYILEKL